MGRSMRNVSGNTNCILYFVMSNGGVLVSVSDWWGDSRTIRF